MNTTEFPPYKGFAILIKAPGVKRSFVPREGETITITDKDGKELWSFKNREGQDNPGVIIYDVHIDLLTARIRQVRPKHLESRPRAPIQPTTAPATQPNLNPRGPNLP